MPKLRVKNGLFYHGPKCLEPGQTFEADDDLALALLASHPDRVELVPDPDAIRSSAFDPADAADLISVVESFAALSALMEGEARPDVLALADARWLDLGGVSSKLKAAQAIQMMQGMGLDQIAGFIAGEERATVLKAAIDRKEAMESSE